ncbi:MAG: hypothetical protein LBU89_07865 [Fibromonadaceae bacterium]|jgi:hypothetical protein|nr:hypothetical protein [Fibromonadaceae bacterium]
MLTDTVLKRKGFEILTQSLGILDSERFVSLILSEPFDYTEWQKDLYGDMPLDEFYERVKTARR